MVIQPAECARFGSLEPHEIGIFPNMEIYGDQEHVFYTSEANGTLNVTCLTSQPHEWSSTASKFQPEEQIKERSNFYKHKQTIIDPHGR